MASFDPIDPAFIGDPHPTYAVLQREALTLFFKGWNKCITRYHDITALLRDRRLEAASRLPVGGHDALHWAHDRTGQGLL